MNKIENGGWIASGGLCWKRRENGSEGMKDLSEDKSGTERKEEAIGNGLSMNLMNL